MVKITCYGGVNEIGGNKILVEDNGTRVMLDFGRRMGEAGKYYEEFIKVRSKSALLDLLKLGILPKINDIYAKYFLDYTCLADEEIDLEDKLPLDEAEDYWRSNNLRPYNTQTPGLHALFISHAHFDHIQDVSFLAQNIPIMCTKTTKTLAKAITDLLQGSVEYQFFELNDPTKLQIQLKATKFNTIFPNELEYKKSVETIPIVEPKSGLLLSKDVNTIERDFKCAPTGTVGSLSYKLIPVGHSVPGASSVLLTTSDGKRILYTGDIRFHGRDEPSIDSYVSELGDEQIDVMLCEGTRIGSEKRLTEEDVYQDILQTVQDTKGLLLIDFGWKDTTRFDTVAKAAAECGRTFIINPKLAYLLYELHMMDPAKYPDPNSYPHIKVYKKRQESCLYSNNDYKKFKAGYLDHWGRNKGKVDQNLVRIAEKLCIGGDPNCWGNTPQELTIEEQKAWELATHHIQHGVPAYEIRSDPGKYILMFSFWDANELFDISTPDGQIPDSKYVRASCEPFNDEMEIDERKLMAWLDKFGVNYDFETEEGGVKIFKRAHVSGHASKPELTELIDKIKPKKLIPIHTTSQEIFKEIAESISGQIEVIIPEQEKIMEV